MTDENQARAVPAMRMIESHDADAARGFIESLSLRRLNYILWDLPPVRPASAWIAEGVSPAAAARIERGARRDRIKTWLNILQNAFEIAIWELDGAPLAILWCLPLSLGSDACSVHFHFSSQGRSHFPRMINQYLEATRTSALLGILPANYKGVREAVEAAGFATLKRVPGACFLARTGRAVDGILYYREGNI